MKLRKKALLPAIAMVLASVIALSGVTYAWFTTSNTATVDTLNVNVKTANGIQVSLDNENWRSTLTAADFEAALGSEAVTVQLPSGAISPVSSAGDVVDGKLQLFLGKYNADMTMKSTQETDVRGTTGNYIAFDLFFKSTMEQVLTLNIGPKASKVVDWAATGDRDGDANTEAAVRVAFIPMGTAGFGDNKDITDPTSLTANGTAMIWEPNATLRANGDTASKETYKGFYAEFDNVKEDALGTAHVKDVTTFVADQAIITLQEGVSRVRVYIWLEGQDIDCINDISFGDFQVTLSFSVPKLAADDTTTEGG